MSTSGIRFCLRFESWLSLVVILLGFQWNNLEIICNLPATSNLPLITAAPIPTPKPFDYGSGSTAIASESAPISIPIRYRQLGSLWLDCSSRSLVSSHVCASIDYNEFPSAAIAVDPLEFDPHLPSSITNCLRLPSSSFQSNCIALLSRSSLDRPTDSDSDGLSVGDPRSKSAAAPASISASIKPGTLSPTLSTTASLPTATPIVAGPANTPPFAIPLTAEPFSAIEGQIGAVLPFFPIGFGFDGFVRSGSPVFASGFGGLSLSNALFGGGPAGMMGPAPAPAAGGGSGGGMGIGFEVGITNNAAAVGDFGRFGRVGFRGLSGLFSLSGRLNVGRPAAAGVAAAASGVRDGSSDRGSGGFGFGRTRARARGSAGQMVGFGHPIASGLRARGAVARSGGIGSGLGFGVGRNGGLRGGRPAFGALGGRLAGGHGHGHAGHG